MPLQRSNCVMISLLVLSLHYYAQSYQHSIPCCDCACTVHYTNHIMFGDNDGVVTAHGNSNIRYDHSSLVDMRICAMTGYN